MHLTMAYLRGIQCHTAHEAFEWLIEHGFLPSTFDTFGKAEEFVGISQVRRAQKKIYDSLPPFE